ncbi:hypothetical protein [Microcoleus sp. bin38.metabat.b11b12b14.051]|uniref:hypothetical protein n=1 Tax=Microcoleus sp. bin38.metabat.b11b12b14.051 TaxID=2742709 RepID=UPI0025F0A3F5|nr:hypothetical protein [Microcoleus sp. bin38.metabat.b11b12b14.051]
MSTIRLELAEYLKSRGFTPDSLVEVIPETVNPQTIYQLIEKPENLRQIDLSLLATVIDGLSQLNGFPVGISEVLILFPDISDEELENSAWRELYLESEIPPYDWGDVNPMTLGKPVRYVSGVGCVITEEEG